MILLTDERIKQTWKQVEKELGFPTADEQGLTEEELAHYRANAKAQAIRDEKENTDATIDYSEGKISVEKWAERLGVNVYDLHAALGHYGRR